MVLKLNGTVYNPQNYESRTLTVCRFAVYVTYTALQYSLRTGGCLVYNLVVAFALFGGK